MWQASNNRSGAAGKKGGRYRYRLPIHLKRIHAVLTLVDSSDAPVTESPSVAAPTQEEAIPPAAGADTPAADAPAAPTATVTALPTKAKVSVDARILLNDISHKGMGLFTSQMLAPGQEVTVRFDEPHHRVSFHATIAWCHEHDLNSHVLFNQHFAFRAGLQFNFKSPEEEKSLKAMCDEFGKLSLCTSKGLF